MPDPGGTKAGFISKPYGLQGKVHLILRQGTGIGIEPGDPLFIELDGQRVPFFVEEVELAADDLAVIKFEFIDSVEEARSVSGCEVFLDPAWKRRPADTEPGPEALVGYLAIDRILGEIGTITGYLPNEQNPLFVVNRPGAEILVPAAGELISEIVHDPPAVFFQLPDGLLEL